MVGCFDFLYNFVECNNIALREKVSAEDGSYFENW
jgi:hypothetical protein